MTYSPPSKNAKTAGIDVGASIGLLSTHNQLKIYDFFLGVRAYQRQCRIKRFVKEVEGADGMSGVESISKHVPFNLDDLPAKIRYSNELLNLLWHNMMDFGSSRIEKRVFSSDDDMEDIEFFILDLGNDGGGGTGLYDAKTYQYLTTIGCSDFDFGFRMEEVLTQQREESHPESALEYARDEDGEKYEHLLQKIDEADEYELTYSDQFTDLRSLFHAKCD